MQNRPTFQQTVELTRRLRAERQPRCLTAPENAIAADLPATDLRQHAIVSL
jgi:hypothetical protein